MGVAPIKYVLMKIVHIQRKLHNVKIVCVLFRSIGTAFKGKN